MSVEENELSGDGRLDTGDRRQATGRKVAQCQTQTRVQTARHRHQTPRLKVIQMLGSNTRTHVHSPARSGSLHALIDATLGTHNRNAWITIFRKY